MAEFARDLKTGDYVMQDGANSGKPAIDTSLAPACFTRLRAHRTGDGRWLHAPDENWGSDFNTYLRRDSTKFSDGLGESITMKALQPIIDDGRADNLDATTQFAQRGGVAIGANLFDRQQQQTYDVKTQVGI